MTTADPSSGPPTAGRPWWLLIALLTAAAAAVLVAVAVVLATGSADQPRTPVAVAEQQLTGPSVLLASPGAPARTGTPQVRAVVHPKAPPMSRSVPTRLVIPAIGVNSDLMSLGLNTDRTLETPPGAFPAGWFTGAPTPGQLGPAIIVGHVRYNTPGVFARLSELRRDDAIHVRRTDGSTATFRVVRVERVAKTAFPTQQVYGDLHHAGLRLITCGGLDSRTDEFEDNLIVFADLVTS